jgi:hypothetical protein
MPKYKLTVRETVWHTFVFETAETEPDDVAAYFYEMSFEEQEAAKVSSDSFDWEVDEIERLEKIK